MTLYIVISYVFKKQDTHETNVLELGTKSFHINFRDNLVK